MRYDQHGDDAATPEQVQAALDVVEAREGPDFRGWSRVNPSLTRKAAWEILRKAPDWIKDRGISPSRRLIVRNIRREFGVHGEKPALASPKKPRRPSKVERWSR